MSHSILTTACIQIERTLCACHMEWKVKFNTLGLRQSGWHLADNTFKCIFLDENIWFVLKSPINNILALVSIMTWCWPGDQPLSEPVLVSLLTHICVTHQLWSTLPMWNALWCIVVIFNAEMWVNIVAISWERLDDLFIQRNIFHLALKQQEYTFARGSFYFVPLLTMTVMFLYEISQLQWIYR